MSLRHQNPSFQVLCSAFGYDPVSRALYRRGSDTASEERLDLAIGVLRTLLHEKKVTPGDIRRVTARWRVVLRQRRLDHQIEDTPSAAFVSTSSNYQVLSSIFGSDAVSRALHGRAPFSQSVIVPTTAENDDAKYTNDDEESLDLAIGILRTLLNESKKLKAGDISRVASRWRSACFGNESAYTIEHEEKRRVVTRIAQEEDVGVVTDDEASADEESPSRSPHASARKEPPRRESSARKLNPPKRRKSSVIIASADIQGCELSQECTLR